MLLLFFVMILLCNFPLFLYYSWFRSDIYMFVRIPVRYFPGIEVVFVLPIFSILLFAIPNSMWYLFATSYVMLSISWRSLWFSVISATSSIHRRHPIYSSVLCSFGPTFLLIIYVFISSIIRAYWMTDSTPPCRMLSVMFISLVCPYLVFNRACRLLLNFLAIFHIGNSVPSLCMM